jgi:CRISPR-associated endonuclease Csn1
MAEQPAGNYILGIDLGSNSLGWALIARENGEPKGLIRAGVRVFEAATEGDRESGQEESRNKARREARLHRRQLWRRARRLKKVFDLLQQYALLPRAKGSTPEQRQDFLNDLDKQILTSPWFATKKTSGLYPEPEQVMPYILRAGSLDERFEPYFLGRALYHLAQRRGFLSNRKAAPKKDEKPGEVDKGINELRDGMAQTGARTLGEYFARLDPFDRRIRQRWTHRGMYKDEFDRIWKAQEAYHAEILTTDRRQELSRAIFFQRPLKFPRSLVGHCELDPEEPRAPRYLFIAQRFRLLQVVNNLKVEFDGAERLLTPEEREKLVETLELEGDRTFAQARKLLKLSKASRFNLERGGEKNLRGNRTTSALYKVFGARWLEMTAAEHDAALHDVQSIQNEEVLKRRAVGHWNLDEAAASAFAKISPEPGYFNLSRKAMERLLPLLETGVEYAKARHQLYPEKFQARGELASLPPVEVAADPAKLQEWIKRRKALRPGAQSPDPITAIRNPAVMRSLSELRKVVNAIVRQYGKPAEIHVELARDLRKPKWQRQETSGRMRENERARKAAAQRILAETGIKEPSPEDIRKVLLAEECRWECPYTYTGKTISMRKLVGHDSEFQIEHILPFSRSLDNSFVNLTLCHVAENAVKGNRTPHEAYSGDPDRYDRILTRVRAFSGNRGIVAEKLRRFQMTPEQLQEFLSDFSARQLTDTAYASKLAARYLGLLYGGEIDDAHQRRVQATSGQVTAYLRNLWLLNRILNDGPTTHGGAVPKLREDHRHHAVDAVTIALTSPATIKTLSDAAQRAPLEHRRRFASIQSPWPDFVDTVRDAVNHIVVSHRVSKKVSGALHEETIYSPPMVAAVSAPRSAGSLPARLRATGDGGATRETVRHVRKPVKSLTKPELAEIVDPVVRQRVQAKLEELGGDLKKFAKEENLPYLETKDGRHIPIKRVRIKKKLSTFALGSGRTAREVTHESNHHLEVFAELDEDGREIEWDGVVVPMLEAYRRNRQGQAIVQREHGPQRRFKFSLAPGEVVECDDGPEKRRQLVVRAVSQYSAGAIVISLVRLNDARKKKDIQESKAWLSIVPNKLRQLHPRKLVVSPLGEVGEAGD